MIIVVIPTLNEASHIGGLLRQVLDEAPSQLAQVIVADGGSTDGTQAIVEGVARQDARVRLLANPKRIQSAGINLAAKLADPSTSVLVRLDAHSGYPPRFVESLAAALAATGADSVVVRLRTSADGCFQRAVASVSNSWLGTGGAAHRVGGDSRWIDHGHHAAFRYDSFMGVGGYDETFRTNEDAELDVRLVERGCRIWFAADLEIEYFPRKTARALARQYYQYGIGRARNVIKNNQRLKPRQLAAPMLTILILLALLITPVLPIALLIPLGYLAASVAAGVMLALRDRTACALGAAVALPAMHLSWGTGFLLTMARRARPSPKP